MEIDYLNFTFSYLILRGNTTGSKAWMSPLARFDEVRAVFEGGALREKEDTTGTSPGSFIF